MRNSTQAWLIIALTFLVIFLSIECGMWLCFIIVPLGLKAIGGIFK